MNASFTILIYQIVLKNFFSKIPLNLIFHKYDIELYCIMNDLQVIVIFVPYCPKPSVYCLKGQSRKFQPFESLNLRVVESFAETLTEMINLIYCPVSR